MKKGWDRYASEIRIKQKGYFRKHSQGSKSRQASKASGSDSILGSEEIKEEEMRPVSQTIVFKRYENLDNSNEFEHLSYIKRSQASSKSPDCLECKPDTIDPPKPRLLGSPRRAKKSRKDSTSQS